MKQLTVVLSILIAAFFIFLVQPAINAKHLIERKLDGDVRAANANERIATALERAYPIETSTAPVSLIAESNLEIIDAKLTKSQKDRILRIINYKR